MSSKSNGKSNGDSDADVEGPEASSNDPGILDLLLDRDEYAASELKALSSGIEKQLPGDPGDDDQSVQVEDAVRYLISYRTSERLFERRAKNMAGADMVVAELIDSNGYSADFKDDVWNRLVESGVEAVWLGNRTPVENLPSDGYRWGYRAPVPEEVDWTEFYGTVLVFENDWILVSNRFAVKSRSKSEVSTDWLDTEPFLVQDETAAEDLRHYAEEVRRVNYELSKRDLLKIDIPHHPNHDLDYAFTDR